MHRTRFILPFLFVLLTIAGSASVAHAAYTDADITSFGGGGQLFPPHCGGGSAVAGGYLDGNPANYPAGFYNNPTHYCFWETEKIINNFKGSLGIDTVNDYGWSVFPGDYTGSGIKGPLCGESGPGPHDICTTTGFRIIRPTAQLSASPSSILQGQSSTLSWSSTAATSCTGSGFTTGGATSGSVQVSPNATQQYSVSCTGNGGSASANATVNVTPTPQPPAVQLLPSPSSVTAGNSSLLTWSSQNATFCQGSNFSTGGATSGSVSTGALSNSKTYSVQCTGPGGAASASATVFVTQAPQGQSASLSASPVTITQGSATTLSYSCSPAAPANIIPTVGTLVPAPVSSGSVTVSPSQTTTYTLNCFGNSAVVSSSATVTVVPAAPPPPPAGPSATLNANPLSVLSGNSSRLSWNSANATSCTGSGFNTGGATSGSISTGPLTTPATYGLTCKGPGGSASANPVTVDVTTTQAPGNPGNPGPNPGPSCGPVSGSVDAAPARVIPGTASVLSLTASGVQGSCILSGPGVHKSFPANSCNVSGSVTTAPITAQSVYTLTCDGTPAGKVVVNINPKFFVF